MKVEDILRAVELELYAAQRKHGPIRSRHEGYAVLKEEVDELWDSIKGNDPDAALVAEAIQVAAMGIRLIHDLTNQGYGGENGS